MGKQGRIFGYATVIVTQWLNKEIGTKAACDMLGISKTTFYRLLKRKGK